MNNNYSTISLHVEFFYLLFNVKYYKYILSGSICVEDRPAIMFLLNLIIYSNDATTADINFNFSNKNLLPSL